MRAPRLRPRPRSCLTRGVEQARAHAEREARAEVVLSHGLGLRSVYAQLELVRVPPGPGPPAGADPRAEGAAVEVAARIRAARAEGGAWTAVARRGRGRGLRHRGSGAGGACMHVVPRATGARHHRRLPVGLPRGVLARARPAPPAGRGCARRRRAPRGHGQVRVLGVWEMLPLDVLARPHSRLADGRPYAGLPSRSWGSDHMALASALRVPRGAPR